MQRIVLSFYMAGFVLLSISSAALAKDENGSGHIICNKSGCHLIAAHCRIINWAPGVQRKRCFFPRRRIHTLGTN
jgi:hypothetical protein